VRDTPKVEIHLGSTVETVTNRDKIAEAFQDHKIKHFSQGKGCKFTRSELKAVMRSAQLNPIHLVPKAREM
jgi:hypothetical protein